MTQELETNYTKIPNQLIDDTSISDKAKVTYIKMRRCAPSWTFSVRGLAKVLKKSIGTISGALKELEEKGFLTSSCCPTFFSFIKKNFPTLA